VAHGAFVVRGERNWNREVSLRIAIGVVINEKEGTVRIAGGPVEAVRNKAKASVVVVPGDLTGKELFKLVLWKLAQRVQKELRETITELSVEEIREFIPYGSGTIPED
jgi:hypothetical protein